MDAEQVLAFRLARSGLAERDGRGLAEAAACPASDIARDSALLALAARSDAVSAEAFAAAVHAGDEIVVAHAIRGAIHALPRADLARYGRSLLRADAEALADPPPASGVRLLPPGDPFLQKANRPLLAPDPAVRTRLFRPVASPGAVLRDGRLAGLWRARAKGRTLELSVEPLRRLRRDELGAEAQRVAELRGPADLRLEIA